MNRLLLSTAALAMIATPALATKKSESAAPAPAAAAKHKVAKAHVVKTTTKTTKKTS